MARTVSQILLEEHNISIRPGDKGECPFCHSKHFSVKADDTLGKCFRPACGRFLTVGHGHGQYQYSLAWVLEAIYQDCHQRELFCTSPPGNGTHTLIYMTNVISIHR